MAQRKKSRAAAAAPSTEPLELTYRLGELPSSQHRAGLVGLVLLTRHLATLGVGEADAAVVDISPTSVRLRFTRAGMCALFDAAFATMKGEVAYDKPLKNRNKEELPALRTEAIESLDGRNKVVSKTKYIYARPIPRGAFLPQVDPTGDHGLWIKLWRDMLWSIPRGVPATRRPFEARAEGEKVTDGEEMFAALQRDRNQPVDLASTYLLGAQEFTADGVGFSDAVGRKLLLYFWPFATDIFVPSTVTRDGKQEFDGYVFAFPDVANLEEYCADYLELLGRRGTEKAGYLPKAAVVDLPGEAGLRTLSWLKRLLEPRVAVGTTLDLEDVVLAVDTIHARKDGNNVRILSNTRIEPRRDMSADYERFASRALWSHLFRRKCLENLIGGRAWFSGFGGVLSTRPSDTTFDDPAFCHDARLLLEETNMPDDHPDLSTLVYRIAARYLTRKLRDKYGLERARDSNAPPDYWKYKEKLAREALLSLRGRTGDDFVAYVTTTIFSVAQGMTREHYSFVARALLDQTDTFRTLLMLAFSAQMPRPQATSGS